MICWVTGRYNEKSAWEILGLYDSEEKAVARCTQVIDYVAPLELNKSWPEEPVKWEGQYYPLAGKPE